MKDLVVATIQLKQYRTTSAVQFVQCFRSVAGSLALLGRWTGRAHRHMCTQSNLGPHLYSVPLVIWDVCTSTIYSMRILIIYDPSKTYHVVCTHACLSRNVTHALRQHYNTQHWSSSELLSFIVYNTIHHHQICLSIFSTEKYWKIYLTYPHSKRKHRAKNLTILYLICKV